MPRLSTAGAHERAPGTPTEALIASGHPFVPFGENCAACPGIKHAEQSHAQMEAALRSGFFACEMAEAPEQFLPALVCEGVNFACLAALAGSFAFAHPAAFHESPKERINEIVVHLAFARN